MVKSSFLKFLFLLLITTVVLSVMTILVTRNSTKMYENAETKADLGKNSERISVNQATPISNQQIEKDVSLQTEADALLYLFDNMASVPVHLVNEPVIKSGTNVEKGVAYTTCRDKKNPIIAVKKNFYEKSNRKQLVNILKHEMTHAWFCRQGVAAEHDARFRRKFESVGGFGN